MRFLLDTVTFIWVVRSPELISQTAAKLFRDRPLAWEISSLSLSELAIKESCGKLDMNKQRVTASLSDLQIRVLPYTEAHAWKMFGLPLHHKDPFDRQIIAQALAEQIPVVTPDRAFRAYEGIEVIW